MEVRKFWTTSELRRQGFTSGTCPLCHLNIPSGDSERHHEAMHELAELAFDPDSLDRDIEIDAWGFDTPL